MKRLIIMALLALSATVMHAQTWTGATLNVSNQIRLRGQSVTNFQTDTFFISNNKVPTSKAVFDFVLGRTANGSQGPQGIQGVQGVQGIQGITNPASVISTGTLNYLPKFSPNSTSLSNSKIFDDGSRLGIGTATPLNKIHIRDTSLFFDADSIKFKMAEGYTNSNFGRIDINIYPPSNVLSFGVQIAYKDVFSNNLDNLDVFNIYGANAPFGIKKSTGQNLIVERKNLNIYPDTVVLSVNTTTGFGGEYIYGNIMTMKIYSNLNRRLLFNSYLKDLYTNTVTPISLTDTTAYSYTMDANPLSRGNRFQIIHTNENLVYPKIILNPELKKTETFEFLALEGTQMKKVKLLEKVTTAQKLAISGIELFEGKEVYDTDLHKKSYWDGTVWVNY